MMKHCHQQLHYLSNCFILCPKRCKSKAIVLGHSGHQIKQHTIFWVFVPKKSCRPFSANHQTHLGVSNKNPSIWGLAIKTHQMHQTWTMFSPNRGITRLQFLMASLKWGMKSQQQGLGMSKELWSSLKGSIFFCWEDGEIYWKKDGIAFFLVAVEESKRNLGGHILSLNNWSTYVHGQHTVDYRLQKGRSGTVCKYSTTQWLILIGFVDLYIIYIWYYIYT